MRRLIFALSLALAAPATAETLLSEVSGNWAGPSNGGFFFRAELTQAQTTARLRIWNGNDSVPTGGEVQFDNQTIALSAYATAQRLEVLDTPNGSVLQVVTEFADEETEGRTVVQIEFLDNQFTVVGYYHQSDGYNPGGDPIAYECELDLQRGKATVNGTTIDLSPVDFETRNASYWTYGAAFDRGYCPRT